MDMLPRSALTEEEIQHQYLADVAQETTERLARGVTALEPNTPENPERWNIAQVKNHESPFSFSDNLTTLMFIVASDLREVQRERERDSQVLFSTENGYPCLYSVRGLVFVTTCAAGIKEWTW